MFFVKKSTFFSYVFFEQKKPERNIFWYPGLKKMLLRPQNWTSNKFEKIDIFPKRLVHGFCQKIDMFFLSKQSQKEKFFDLLDRK